MDLNIVECMPFNFLYTLDTVLIWTPRFVIQLLGDFIVDVPVVCSVELDQLQIWMTHLISLSAVYLICCSI